MKFSKILSIPVNLLSAAAVAALLLLPFSAPFAPANAAATSQTTHAVLCRPDPSGAAAGPSLVTNPNTSANYSLNSAGCAVIAGADIGYFLSQGYTGGGALFTLQARAVAGGSSGTASVTTGQTLPIYGLIVSLVLCETAGNAVTGGLNIGDAGSATRFGSAVALAANACVTVADSALTRLVAPSGVPAASTILLAAVTSWNSASVNVTVVYTYY